MKSLKGAIALVAGATRGAGRAIADRAGGGRGNCVCDGKEHTIITIANGSSGDHR